MSGHEHGIIGILTASIWAMLFRPRP